MILQALLLALPAYAPPSFDLLAIRVGRAETGTGEAIEHAVVLVEGSKIVAVGEDLPVERGIPVLDRPDWVLTPGFVLCHTRLGVDGRGGNGSDAHRKVSDALHPSKRTWDQLLEDGYTTLGVYPAGGGIPGQAVAVRPKGDSIEDMILADSVYLKVRLASNPGSKKMLRDGFEEADKYDEEVAKAREKWEKEKEKADKKKKKKSKKDDDEKEEEDEDDKKDEEEAVEVGPFVPPVPDDKARPFLALRAQELAVLFDIRKAADYLHLLDALGEEDVTWSLLAPDSGYTDFDEVAERIGEDGRRIVLTSNLTLQPFTRRERNLAAEFDRAGAAVALIPSRESQAGEWRHEVGRLVAAGLDRDAAFAAMTLEPARVLGLGDRLGSIEPDKDANLLLWDGDPFEPTTNLQAVMLEGRFVEGDVRQ